MRQKKVQAIAKKIQAPGLKFRDEREIALDFASKVHKKFGNIVKATILFGSQAKKSATSVSDIDILILIDDASISWDMELIAWYREELGKLTNASAYAKDLHVNTIKLTTWWLDLLHGDAVVMNMLRYGEALIDIGGFFNPLKALLLQGKIRSTPEAAYAALQRAPEHLARSKIAELGAIEGVYWTMVDSAQAALIMAGKVPPSPEHIPQFLKEAFVDTKMLNADYVTWYRDVFLLHKSVIHGEARNIHGSEIDNLQEKAETFMKKMTEVIENLLGEK